MNFTEIAKALRTAGSKGSGPSGYLRIILRGGCSFLGGIRRKPPASYLILLHRGRSGSTIVGKILDRQSGIYWDGEILTKAILVGEIDNLKKWQSGSEQREIYYRHRSQRSNGEPFGFEIKFDQLKKIQSSPIAESKLLQQRPIKFVVMERENHLRLLVSVAQGVNTGNWHAGTPSDQAVNIDPKNVLGWNLSLIQWLNERRKEYASVKTNLEENNTPFLSLSFEHDVLPDPNIAANKIFDFWDLPKANFRPLKGASRNQRYRHLRELISNYDEVADSLIGTEFDHFLNETG